MISLSELEKLKKDFYMQNGLDTARNLLGKYLIRVDNDNVMGGIIVETEAYIGPYDDAAHSYNYIRTKRVEAMYEEGGIAYIYQIYGMHFCLNVVCSSKNNPQAVLIRAIEPKIGLEHMKKNRSVDINNLTNGPGKLSKALNIDLALNRKSFLSNELYIAKTDNNSKFEIASSKRINIEYAKRYKDKPWRFYIKNNPYVSQ